MSLEDRITAIKDWCNKHSLTYLEVNSPTCADRVYNLLVNGEVYNKKYENSVYYVYLGHHYRLSNNTDKMSEYFNLAAKLGSGSAMNNLAVYYYKGDKEKRIKYYKMAIRHGNRTAMRNLAEFYSKKNDHENMVKYYEMAIDKGNLKSMVRLADHYYKIKDYNRALKYYMLANNSNSDDGKIIALIGLCYEKLGNEEEMLKYYNMAKDKNAGLAMNQLGCYYYKNLILWKV